ncbi:GNAT family N-acetyltransferase [Streptomyces rubiginosohelvolus]|uniref:GNAT family N-acetyltransferase n=1 Tax=Streptomyces rubiginosohelvolus TaxID=67362 RepID=UPI0036DAA8E7
MPEAICLQASRVWIISGRWQQAVEALSGNLDPVGTTRRSGLLTELALRSKAHWKYSPEFLASCREELTLRDTELAGRRAAVAERDGSVVGFTTLEGEPPRGVLGMMFVDPCAIGQGIGRLMFDHTVEAARVLGFKQLSLRVISVMSAQVRAAGRSRSPAATAARPARCQVRVTRAPKQPHRTEHLPYSSPPGSGAAGRSRSPSRRVSRAAARFARATSARERVRRGRGGGGRGSRRQRGRRPAARRKSA